jgi:hypothetical protein
VFDWGTRAEQTQVLDAVGQLSEVTTLDVSVLLAGNVLATLIGTVACPCVCWAPGSASAVPATATTTPTPAPPSVSDQDFSEAFMRAVCFLTSSREPRALSSATFASEGLVVSERCINNLVWLCANDVLVTDTRNKVNPADPLKLTPVDCVRLYSARMLQTATASHLIRGTTVEVRAKFCDVSSEFV